MKMKNKKILTRLLAVLATCLLLVALAVPCFADETDPPQYVLTEVTSTDYNELFNYTLTNYNLISHVVLENGDDNMILRPSAKLNNNGIWMLVFVSPIFVGDGSDAIDSSVSVSLTSYSATVTLMTGSVNSSLLVQNRTYTGEDLDNLSFTLYAYEPAELTPVPVDPDAPTRTGLYGELYHIIRDAIYGENALLDSTQEFTLTQISTWMTYIVILLPLVVIGIILFKIFVR